MWSNKYLLKINTRLKLKENYRFSFLLNGAGGIYNFVLNKLHSSSYNQPASQWCGDNGKFSERDKRAGVLLTHVPLHCYPKIRRPLHIVIRRLLLYLYVKKIIPLYNIPRRRNSKQVKIKLTYILELKPGEDGTMGRKREIHRLLPKQSGRGNEQ